MLKIGVFGATGKVGREVVSIIADTPDLTISLATTSETNDAVGRFVKSNHPNLDEVIKYSTVADASELSNSEVLIDFSLYHCVKEHIEAAVTTHCPYVVGVSNLDQNTLNMLNEAAKVIPIIYADSTSLGITVMRALTVQAAKLLDKSFDIEINETHHRGKLDAPSGVAKAIAKDIAVVRGENPSKAIVIGRNAKSDVRKSGQIGISSSRGGKFTCKHDVNFYGDDENITISHTGQSRALFARGAITAARWVINRPVGIYDMSDVLGL